MEIETMKSDVGMSWKTVKLGEIFEIARGGSPRPIESFLTTDAGGVNWIMISDTIEGGKYIEKTAKKIKREGVPNSRMVNEGDFLLTNSMSFGRPYILKTSGCIHDGWLVLSPKNENINRDFFYYYLGSEVIKQRLSSKAAGAVVKNLNKEIVSDLVIELPPLATQKRIAEILDAADALRRKDQELLKKYDELAQAIFVDMFGDPVKNEKGWEVKTIGDSIDFITSGSRGWAQFYSESGDLFLRINNVGYNEIKLGDLIYVKAPDNAEANRTKVQAGDILMSITADLGRTCVIPCDFPKAYINQHLAILRLKPQFEPNFVSQFFTTEFGKNQFKKLNKGGVKAGLNFEDIKSLEFINPPLEVQKKYSEALRELRNHEEFNRLRIEKTNDLFSTLIQKAFKGELVS